MGLWDNIKKAVSSIVSYVTGSDDKKKKSSSSSTKSTATASSSKKSSTSKTTKASNTSNKTSTSKTSTSKTSTTNKSSSAAKTSTAKTSTAKTTTSKASTSTARSTTNNTTTSKTTSSYTPTAVNKTQSTKTSVKPQPSLSTALASLQPSVNTQQNIPTNSALAPLYEFSPETIEALPTIPQRPHTLYEILSQTRLSPSQELLQNSWQLSDSITAKNAALAKAYTENDVRETYDANAAGSNVRGNTKYKVNTVNSMSYKDVATGLGNGDYELWVVEDGDSIKHDKLYNRHYEVDGVETSAPTYYHTIGKDRLDGISADEKYVIYDPDTGKFYRYAQDDTVDEKRRTAASYESQIQELTKNFTAYKEKSDTRLQTIADELQGYIDRAQATPLTDEEYTAFQTLYDQYNAAVSAADTVYNSYSTRYGDILDLYNTNNTALKNKGMTGEEVSTYYALKPYIEAAARVKNGTADITDRDMLTQQYHSLDIPAEVRKQYQDLNTRMHASAGNTVYVNEEYRAALDAYVDDILKGTAEYDAEASHYADFNSSTQVNTLLDVVKRATARTAWGQFSDTTPTEDLAEWWHYKTDSVVDAATGEDASVGKVSKASLMSALMELGEDLDVTNVIKPFVVGSMYYAEGNYEDPNYAIWLREQTQKEWENLDSGWKGFWTPPEGTMSPGYTSGESQYAGWVAFKASLGYYGDTPTFDYINAIAPEERSAGIQAACMAMDIILDPGTWIDLAAAGTKVAKAGTSTAEAAEELLAKQYDNWAKQGAVIVNKTADSTVEGVEQLMKQYAEQGVIAIVRSDETDQAILNAYNKAVKRAYDAGGAVASMQDELINASIRNTTAMFNDSTVSKIGRALDPNSIAKQGTQAYLDGLNNLAVDAKMNYKRALDDFMAKTAAESIDTFKQIAKTDGTAIADLVYKTPTIISTLHRYDEIQSTLNKALLAVAAPALSVPVAMTRGLMKITGQMTTPALLKQAVEAVGSLSKQLTDAVTTHQAFSSTLKGAMEDVAKTFSVLYAKSGQDVEAALFYKQFKKTTLEAYADHVLSDTMQPLFKIMSNTDPKHSGEVLKQLDDWAQANGFASFSDANKALIHNVDTFTDMSDHAKAIYAEYQRLYRNAVANSKIYNAEQMMSVYRDTLAKATEQLNGLHSGADIIVSLENIHSTIQVMRDHFSDAFRSPIMRQDYEDAANAVIDSLKTYGDDITDVAAHDAFVAQFNAFDVLTQNYVKNIQDYRDTIAFINYRHRPQTEYISAITDKQTLLKQQVSNRVAAGIQKELQKHHGLNVTVQEIQDNLIHSDIKDALLDADGTLNLDAVERLYRVQLDKYTNALQYTSDEAMQHVVTDVLDINTSVNCALRNVQAEIESSLDALRFDPSANEALIQSAEKQLDDIQTFFNTCSEQKNTRKFFTRFEEEARFNGVQDTEINAVLDAFAGDKTHRINANARAWMETRNNHCVDNIVDAIKTDATEYLRQTSDAPVDYLWHFNCNTVDTAANVDEIAKQAVGVIEPSDEYIDVYYSCAGTLRGADPHMISFKVGGVNSTFRNADSPFTALMSHETTARNMYGKSSAEVAQDYLEVCKRVPGTSKEDYVQQIQSYIMTLNQRATDNNKQLRFIGFNAGAATSETDRFIKDFLVSNGISVRWNSAIDLGEVIRTAKGYATISDGTAMAIRKAITETLESARTDTLLHGVTGSIVMDTDPRLIAQVSNLKRITQQYSDDATRALTGMFDGVEHTARTIDTFRLSIIGSDFDTVLSERAIAKYIDDATLGLDPRTRINCMRALYGTIADLKNISSGNIQVQKIFDEAIMKEWFDPDVLKHLISDDMVATTVSNRMSAVYDMAKGLERHYSQIANPELLTAIGTDAYKEVFDVFITTLQRNVNTAGSDVSALLGELKLNTAQDYFAALSYLQTHYGRYVSLDDVSRHLKNLDRTNALKSKNWYDALSTIYPDTASELVYNSAHTVRRYDTHTKIIETKYADVNERTVRTRIMMQDAKTIAKDTESLGTYLDLKEAVYEANRLLTADERINYELFSQVYKPYLDFVDQLNIFTPMKGATSHQSAFENALARAEFDTDMAAKMQSITKLNTSHKAAAVTAALMLDNKSFETYVLRDCMNALVIDPNAVMFKGTPGVLLGRKLTELLNDTTTGLKVERYTVDGRECIRIYKDLNGYSAAELDALLSSVDNVDLGLTDLYRGALTDVAAHLADKTQYDTFAHRAMQEYMSQMTKYMPDHYYGSTMDVLTQDAVNALQQLFPESSRLHTGRIRHWFDESYNCSVWGDIEFQRIYNPYASDKVIDNIGRGLHHVQNKMEATTNLMRMFDNPTQSLRSMVEAANAQNATWKQIRKQLDDRGYVLATIKRSKNGTYSAVKLPLNSKKDLTRYLTNDSVIVLDGSMYGKINKYANSLKPTALYTAMHGHVVQGKMYDMYLDWLRTLRSSRVTSALFLSNMFGTGIRNVLDSTIKGFNDRGMSFVHHIQNAVEYQSSYKAIYADILERYKHVDSTTIAKYYNEVGDTGEGIVKQIADAAVQADPANKQLQKAAKRAAKAQAIPQSLFEELHVFNEMASSGMSALLDITQDSNVQKLQSLLPANKYTDTELSEVTKIFNQVHAQRAYVNVPGALKDTVQMQMYDDVLKRLQTMHPKNSTMPIYTASDAKELADLFFSYTPPAQTWGNKMQNSNTPFGWIINTNAKVFEDAETRTRTALYLSYIEDAGATASKAEQAVVRTQFDYSKVGLIGQLEQLMPFTTFKIYNANYWMTEATKRLSTMKLMTRYAEATDRPYDEQDIAQQIRNTHIAQLMKDTQTQTGEDEQATGLKGWFTENILGYRGVSEMYASGIPLGSNHYLKVGNSFTDAITLCSDLLYAPVEIAHGQMPTVLSDSIYAPLGTLYKFMTDLNPLGAAHKYITGLKQKDGDLWAQNPALAQQYALWAQDNYYDVLNLIPFLGMTANMVLTHIKNGALNLADFKAMMCDESLRDAYVTKMFQSMCDLAGTILPAFVGTLQKQNQYGGSLNYYEREIGLNWTDNTNIERIMQRINPATGQPYTQEEAEAYAQQYRSTHQYVTGVSSLPSFMGKDPATYVNYTAMLLRMGFSEEDVKENLGKVLEQLYGGGLLNDPRTNGVYFMGTDGAYLDINMIQDTMAALAAKGYTIDEVISLLKSQKWYDPRTGEFRTDAEAYREMLNAAFLENYQHLPEYIRYDREQYSALVQYWKANGLTTEQAWIMMQREHGYIDEQGRYRILTDAQVEAYTKELNDAFYEFSGMLPEWYRYEPGATSRTLNYFIERGMTREQAQQYILEHNAYVDIDGKLHFYTDKEMQEKAAQNTNDFYEFYSTLPDYLKYEKGAYGRTLKYLKDMPGISEEEAKQMIKNGAYLTVDGRLINCLELQRPSKKGTGQLMSDEEWDAYYQSLPDYTKYTKGAFKKTYNKLKELGYDKDTILKMIQEGAYLDDDGNIINVAGKEKPVLGYPTFNAYYQSLPDYIKYEKGAYKRTYAALKELGFDYEQCLSLIKQGAYLMEAGTVASVFNTLGSKRDVPVVDLNTLIQRYGGTIITQDGKDYMLVDCIGLTRSRSRRGSYTTTGDRYTSYHYSRSYNRRSRSGRGSKSYGNPKRFLRPKNGRAIKHYVKPFYTRKPYVTKGSYSSTYSKVDFLAGASYGARKAFKVTLGYNPVRQSLSIKSTYPASYRNIVYSTRRNMYKDQYAKYGASRMLMRANVSNSYSNASIVRLRRNEIQNRTGYGNRRKF